MLTHDLRDAARNLRRTRGFAASAIAILAIGIAASTGYPGSSPTSTIVLTFGGPMEAGEPRLAQKADAERFLIESRGDEEASRPQAAAHNRPEVPVRA